MRVYHDMLVLKILFLKLLKKAKKLEILERKIHNMSTSIDDTTVKMWP